MNIRLNKIVPIPIKDSYSSSSTCWNQEVELNSKLNTVVEAVSGKGKSTFVNTLFGIRTDYQGQILFDSKDIQEISAREWSEIRQTKLAVVFQDLQLIPHLSVAENLLLKNELTHHKTVEQQQEMVERVGLLDKWNTACGILSYGQQQRIAIVRALLQPFEIILLDEPFAHLDASNSQNCYQLIKEEALKQQASLVLTTLNDAKIDQFDQHLFL